MTIITDDSRVITKLETSLTDNARVVIYDRHMFIEQASVLAPAARWQNAQLTIPKIKGLNPSPGRQRKWRNVLYFKLFKDLWMAQINFGGTQSSVQS